MPHTAAKLSALLWIGWTLACGSPDSEATSASGSSGTTGDDTGPTGAGTAGPADSTSGTADETADGDTGGTDDGASTGGTDDGGSTGGNDDTGTTGDDTGTTGEPQAPPYPDLALGPYPSLLTMAIDSMLANTESLDTSVVYSHSAGQGYVLQAIGELLWAARDYDLPERDALIDAALGEIAELQAADDQVVGGGPGFGLDEAWDAFGDGSTNPAYTAYTWQSGMTALGVAKIARVLDDLGHPAAGDTVDYATALVERWDDLYTAVPDGGYWWYSTQPADAIAVHNTSALVAMASQIASESGGPASLATRPPDAAALLWARMSGNPTDGYVWNYADDGIPPANRNPEDVSHALVTLQLMREARDRDWWADNQMAGVAATLTDNMWSGNPARLHGRVDGSDAGDAEWGWTRAAVIGYAAHGNSPGGDPAVFERARALMFSSYLSRFERPLEGGTVDSARTLALALLLARRPEALADGSEWVQVAQDGDDAIPDEAGGVRFYTIDWAAPADIAFGLTLPARVATAPGANLLVDLEDGESARVLVSITYSSGTAGNVAQWNGSEYFTLAPLPATTHDDGQTRWMRATFELTVDGAFDYQGGVVGTNVLLQVSANGIAVHSIEASRL